MKLVGTSSSPPPSHTSRSWLCQVVTPRRAYNEWKRPRCYRDRGCWVESCSSDFSSWWWVVVYTYSFIHTLGCQFSNQTKANLVGFAHIVRYGRQAHRLHIVSLEEVNRSCLRNYFQYTQKRNLFRVPHLDLARVKRKNGELIPNLIESWGRLFVGC